MSKHTAGPWQFITMNRSGRYMVLADNTKRIAEIMGRRSATGEKDDERRIANALLIAAAPDILEALRRIAIRVDCEDYSKSELISVIRNGERIAAEAVAKAEGK